jgi:hypothetical protein
LIGRCILDEDGGDQRVAVGADVFPAPLDIMNLVGGQFSLGIGQIFCFPMVDNCDLVKVQ